MTNLATFIASTLGIIICLFLVFLLNFVLFGQGRLQGKWADAREQRVEWDWYAWCEIHRVNKKLFKKENKHPESVRAVPRKQSAPSFEQNGISGHMMPTYTKNETHWKKNLNKETKEAKSKINYQMARGKPEEISKIAWKAQTIQKWTNK